ncbi:MAG TPA: M56 family metallopeptidase [Bryobacteraceae bacterium]|jgi:TonB family protein
MTWIFWGELFIRSALLLAAIEGVRKLSKSLPATYRHSIVLAGFALLAALPVLSVVLPPIHLAAFFSGASHASVTVSTETQVARQAAAGRGHVPAASLPVLFWIAGTILALVPLIAGRLLLLRAMRSASRLRDDAWVALADELATRLGMRPPRLLILRGSLTPLAFGLFRPTIVLPPECLQWTDIRRRIVLVHELTHIRRIDVAWQLFAAVVCAVWWFQPLAWMARRRLRQESEHACDAQVLAAGIRPSDYATQLVEIARGSGFGRLAPAALCMARKDELEPRLVRILATRVESFSIRRLMIPTVLIAAVAATAPAVTLRKNESHRGGSMRKTFLSSLLTSATLSAATISGSLFDPTGVAVPDAKLVLHSAETSADLEGTSGPDGKFSFGDLGAGQYILRVEKPGFTDLLREFTVKADSTIERGLVLQVSGRDEPQANRDASARLAQPFAPERIRVKGDVAQANLIRKVQPVYPAPAKAAHVQGTVLLKMIILKDGTPGEITVASSPSHDLSEASLDAVRQWRYRPTLLNGEPIEVLTDVTVNFTLSQ